MEAILTHVGGHLVITIPPDVAAKLGLKEGDRLLVFPTPTGIHLRKSGGRPRRPLRELVDQIDPAAYARQHRLTQSDPAVGREMW